MKFLVDRCAGRRVAEWLRDQGHDVLESRMLGLDPGDEELLEMAAEQSRTLVTIDTDFGELVFLNRASHSGLIRLPDVPAQRRVKLMESLLLEHGKDIEARAIITVRGERIRISRPPE